MISQLWLSQFFWFTLGLTVSVSKEILRKEGANTRNIIWDRNYHLGPSWFGSGLRTPRQKQWPKFSKADSLKSLTKFDFPNTDHCQNSSQSRCSVQDKISLLLRIRFWENREIGFGHFSNDKTTLYRQESTHKIHAQYVFIFFYLSQGSIYFSLLCCVYRKKQKQISQQIPTIILNLFFLFLKHDMGLSSTYTKW